MAYCSRTPGGTASAPGKNGWFLMLVFLRSFCLQVFLQTLVRQYRALSFPQFAYRFRLRAATILRYIPCQGRDSVRLRCAFSNADSKHAKSILPACAYRKRAQSQMCLRRTRPAKCAALWAMTNNASKSAEGACMRHGRFCPGRFIGTMPSRSAISERMGSSIRPME